MLEHTELVSESWGRVFVEYAGRAGEQRNLAGLCPARTAEGGEERDVRRVVRVRPDCKATGESFTASHFTNGPGPGSRGSPRTGFRWPGSALSAHPARARIKVSSWKCPWPTSRK